jgi:hypothetical protein
MLMVVDVEKTHPKGNVAMQVVSRITVINLPSRDAIVCISLDRAEAYLIMHEDI